MPIAPNTTFFTGYTLTATQLNAFPRGVIAFASSPTNYTLTATETVATGMSVTWTAAANRYYRITYYEPQVQTPAAISGLVNLSIKDSNAVGTTMNYGRVTTSAALTITGTGNVVAVVTYATAANKTVVGVASVNVTTGAPTLQRSATAPAFMLVEDIGPA